VYSAPQGCGAASRGGLNAFQIWFTAMAVTASSLILFVMFVVALDRYEKQAEA